MYKMIEFFKSEVFLIVLTIVSMTCTKHPYMLVFMASLLMVLFCVRSLGDEPEETSSGEGEDLCKELNANPLLWWVQAVLSVVYCILAGGMFASLIFCELKFCKMRYINIFLPTVVYLCIAPIFQDVVFARFLLNSLILLVISALVYVAERLVRQYISAQSKVSDIVKVSAVSELYERKLNRELTVKNYLADKNARLEERENISRNIHNSVGHSITAAIMTLDAADMLYETNPELAREKMHIAGDRIKSGLESIRHAVRVLDKESESISCDDFEKTISAVADEFAMDTSIKIRIAFTRISENVKIPHEYVEFLTGAFKELLTNGVKHGKADMFSVEVLSDSAHIRMSVRDNGKSELNNDSKDIYIKNGFGLKKIELYVKRCGGTTAAIAEDGFRYEITLPVLKEDNYG